MTPPGRWMCSSRRSRGLTRPRTRQPPKGGRRVLVRLRAKPVACARAPNATRRTRRRTLPATRRKPAIRQPAPVADLDAVAEFAAGLSDAKLLCRMNKRHIADPARTKVRPPTRHDPTHVMEGPCIICGQPVKRRFDEGYGRVRV